MAKEKPIAKVTHYFPKVQVAVLKLNANLKIGDKVKFVRGEEEFSQTIKSMQIDHKDIKKKKKGKEVGVKVKQKVKEGWEVYKA